MDELEYEVLSGIARGQSVFRPKDRSPAAQQAFGETVGLLLRLRRGGLIDFTDSRISKTEQGSYLAVGPVTLTPQGLAALTKDRRLGLRPPRTYDRPWRYEE
jgi:hypothetical protein